MSSSKFHRKMPKIELHAHLNGSLSIETIMELANDVKDEKDAKKFILEQPTTMEEVFRVFPVIQALMTNEEAVRKATENVIKDFAAENTVYLELRTTPKHSETMSRKQYIAAVLQGIKNCSNLEIVVRLILSIDRRQNVEDAKETVELAISDDSGLIVGVELSGDPAVDGQKFIPLLEKARQNKLGVAVHLAELESNTQEIGEFIKFRPDRIGHGTFLHKEDRWVKKIEADRIPFEICLTSNIMCKTTLTAADSHLPFWKNRGIPVAICTDDRGLMGISLSGEMELAANTFGLSPIEMKTILLDSIEIAFLDKNSTEYKTIRNKIENYF